MSSIPSTQSSVQQIPPLRTRICDHCHRPGSLMKKCGACAKVIYCDIPCQRAAWPKHKPVCLLTQTEQVDKYIAESDLKRLEPLMKGLFTRKRNDVRDHLMRSTFQNQMVVQPFTDNHALGLELDFKKPAVALLFFKEYFATKRSGLPVPPLKMDCSIGGSISKDFCPETMVLDAALAAAINLRETDLAITIWKESPDLWNSSAKGHMLTMLRRMEAAERPALPGITEQEINLKSSAADF